MKLLRLYRKRRREGMQYVRIPLRATEVQDLISMGQLSETQRHDAEAIQAAALGVFHMAMEEMREWFLLPRSSASAASRRTGVVGRLPTVLPWSS